MPHSAVNISDKNDAVMYEALYLVNILLFPGLAFIALVYFYFRVRPSKSELADCHLQQTFVASITAGILLVAVPACMLVIMFLFEIIGSVGSWIVLILYFVTTHAFLVLLGALGLAAAMAEKHYHYIIVKSKCSGLIES